ncbi:protein of unknown function DUF805 [Methylocella silvestris BL2]|uniref:DUF805 domain-containing protein n=1 Tax=Methylocella silvestris (strain DSM 15510 / CIP 108128 / LMG 27833 / NCIMB 13906 / BL2) TaxID=395965 RepID=B8EQ32_METSB|nr:DUF805 domain-containing protein [Methylocella silvestris]ACK51522.1 protein of unknown function DUF805 [Methylocella silvestris BL2]
MTEFWNYYLSALRKYAVFTGRASRAEFWGFVLIYFLICIAALILDRLLGTAGWRSGLFLSIAEIGQLLPLIAVSVRRLHDTDRTGWWQLLMLSGIGLLLLIFFYSERGALAPNRFGLPPTGASSLL